MRGGFKFMTRNQIEYLKNEETKRNNLVVSTEVNRHNVATENETKRNNLVISNETHRTNKANEGIKKSANKETKRHNKATEKLTNKQISTSTTNAKIAADANKYSATISAQASRDVAAINAQASKYATDVKAANDAAIAAQNNTTKEKIQTSVNETNKFLKAIDEMLKLKDLDQQERIELSKIRKDLAIANKKLKLEGTKTQINSVLALIREGNTLIQTIRGKSK